ncbi:MAG: GNAT family N-acetyltransferase [Coriobacteriales bacterium]|jgi:putative acetyltransferase
MPVREFDSANDLAAVMQLWLDGNLDAHSFVPAEHWDKKRDDVERAIGGADVVVYEEDGEVLGFAGCTDGHIDGMFVRADSRSRGIGTQLLEAVKENFGNITLEVYLQNPRAMAFYQREGFQHVGSGMDAETFRPQTTMMWRSPLVEMRIEVPDDLEEQLSQAREELGEAAFQELLAKVRSDIESGNVRRG